MFTSVLALAMVAQVQWNKPDPATRTIDDYTWVDGEREYTFYIAVTVKKVSDDPEEQRAYAEAAFKERGDKFCGSGADVVYNNQPEILGEGREKDGTVNVTIGRLGDCRPYFG